MTKSRMLSLALCVAIMLGGCSKGENPIENSSSKPWQPSGLWEVRSATLNGVATPFIDVLHRPANTWTEAIAIDGGNYTVNDYDYYGVTLYTETGTLNISGQNITFTVKTVDGQPLNASEQRSGQWAGSGDSLTLSISDGGRNVVIGCIRVPYSSPVWDY